MNKILLVITGSVAAYKTLDLIRLLKKSGYVVTTIMTRGAEQFITPLLVSSISGSNVYRDLFDIESESKMGHINLSREADLIVVAPASANFIAKISNGMADDLASAVLLAANKKIFIAPAMNEKMWNNKITKSNIEYLRGIGIKILEPETDMLVCGEYGVGKMSGPDIIFNAITSFFSRKKIFASQKIIITAGATFEAIDPVRFIGNYSSGKQGVAIAEVLYEQGAQVLLIAANVKVPINLPRKNVVTVSTAEEMLMAVESNLQDVVAFISSAAVADFKPKVFSPKKIKKFDKKSINLELVANVDILKSVSISKERPKILIGFAAESDNLLKNAQVKLQEKKCDLIVANDVDQGKVFGSDCNKVYLLANTVVDSNTSGFIEVEELELMSKLEVAEKIAERLAALINVK